MAENCEYSKISYSSCSEGNTKKKYKFTITKPEKNGGKCEYSFKLNNQQRTININSLQSSNWINEEDCQGEDCVYVRKPYSLCTNNKKKYQFTRSKNFLLTCISLSLQDFQTYILVNHIYN